MQQICPTGFVIPDDPSHPGVHWINGTSCAVSCPRSPYLSSSQYDEMYSLSSFAVPLVLLAISAPIFLYAIFWGGKWKKNYLFLVFYVCTLPITFVNIVAHIMNYFENGSAFCADNAVPFGPMHSSDLTICSVQAIMMTYFQWASMFAFTIINIEMAAIIVFNKSLLHLCKVFCSIIFLCPMIPTVLILLLKGYGYEPPYELCNTLQQNVSVVPIVILLVTSSICLVSCYATIFLRYQSAQTEEIKTQLCSHKVLFSSPMLFSTIGLLVYAYMLYQRLNIVASVQTSHALGLWQEHVDCIFANFDGESDESWIPVCGNGMKSLHSVVNSRKYSFFLFNSQHVLVALSFIPFCLSSLIVEDPAFVGTPSLSEPQKLMLELKQKLKLRKQSSAVASSPYKVLSRSSKKVVPLATVAQQQQPQLRYNDNSLDQDMLVVPNQFIHMPTLQLDRPFLEIGINNDNNENNNNNYSNLGSSVEADLGDNESNLSAFTITGFQITESHRISPSFVTQIAETNQPMN